MTNIQIITVTGRKSPLSQAQIEEVLLEIRQHHPEVAFDTILFETTGDLDLKTSLRSLDKTDFFTKEIDDFLLSGQCEIAIHSAKDLPAHLKKGLAIIAITKGVDRRDSLVFRKHDSLQSLKKGAIIGTSSVKREEVIQTLRSDFIFQDIRGPIHKRLHDLESGKIDAVVIAEAALIRLKLNALNRLILDGETTAGQGQLAILAREDNHKMKKLFSKLDTR